MSTQTEPQVHPTSMGLHHPMPDMASASVDRLPVHQQEEVARHEEGEWQRQEEKRRVGEHGEYHGEAKDYDHAKDYHHDHYRMGGGTDEELPESPSYNQAGFQDSSQYGETSASASNSGEDSFHFCLQICDC